MIINCTMVISGVIPTLRGYRHCAVCINIALKHVIYIICSS